MSITVGFLEGNQSRWMFSSASITLLTFPWKVPFSPHFYGLSCLLLSRKILSVRGWLSLHRKKTATTSVGRSRVVKMCSPESSFFENQKPFCLHKKSIKKIFFSIIKNEKHKMQKKKKNLSRNWLYDDNDGGEKEET